MPTEKFNTKPLDVVRKAAAVHGIDLVDDAPIEVSWGTEPNQVTIDAKVIEKDTLDKLIKTLTKARKQAYGSDKPQTAKEALIKALTED